VAPIADPEMVVKFWKPHGVLTAFTDREGRETLSDYIDVPDIYAAGRLDRDSEGLLVLTRSKRLRGLLMDPDVGHPRTYLVQVEGVPDAAALQELADRVDLKDGPTRKAVVEPLGEPPRLPPRRVPIRIRRSVPDTWIRLHLTEGRNRQVRRMTAAVGYPTLRIVREAIGPVSLENLSPGDWLPLDADEVEDLWASVRSATETNRQALGPRRQGPGSRR